MSELAYSFHLGRNKNRTTSSRSNAKNNLSNSTSLANNGIQNYQQLSKVNNHDFRKYDNYTKDIYTLKGTNDIVYDVKDFYKKEFEEARIEYNNKQSRPSRRIENYFEYVSNDEKRDLACEIIIELGNKSFWETKDEDYRKKMVNVYSKNLECLKELVPEFKITNAVVHLDETSPHMHIVGVPVKDNCKTGLSKQANKSSVFTKDRLEHIYLFDEVEKAHPDVFNVLLQVLDDGRITDSQGRTVDFKNTILIMTSNIGSQFLLDGIDENGEIEADAQEMVMDQLRGSFKPEFLNRLDEIIMFKPLTKDNISAIIDLQLKEINDLMKEKELSIELTDAAKELTADRSYDPAYGARPLKRFLQKNVTTLAARLILEGNLDPDDVIVIDVGENGELYAKVKKTEE